MKSKSWCFSLLVFFLSILSGYLVAAQKAYQPTIVVLDPYSVQYDTVLAKELSALIDTDKLSVQEEKILLDSFNKREPNSRLMHTAQLHYQQQENVASMFSYSLYSMILYMVFGENENCLVLPSHDRSSGLLPSLKAIAAKHKVQWVVSPQLLHIYKENGAYVSEVRLQVYDAKLNKIIIENTYRGDAHNPGSELSCDQGSFECTVHNIIDEALPDILLQIIGPYQH